MTKSSNFKIHFSGRGHTYTDKELAVITKAITEADPLTQGTYLKAFEEAFEEYIDAESAFAVCNATAGLEIVAQLCCFEPGDEVIIPSHTFTSSAYPFIKKGANLVWVDIDLPSRVVTAELVDSKITSNTKAIVVPHLYGFVADMPNIM